VRDGLKMVERGSRQLLHARRRHHWQVPPAALPNFLLRFQADGYCQSWSEWLFAPHVRRL